ncbi:hypothetical protein [Arenimonas composti]|uniref:hypothetical protein n=1 Tax=Arenimonas composti TaxID=370776 RepID=UPI0012B5E3FE|nr:hypothetical protein [Arenimonas composti]
MAITDTGETDLKKHFIPMEENNNRDTLGMSSQGPVTIPGRVVAMGHPHPSSGASVRPMPDDAAYVEQGYPMYVYMGKRVGVLESSGGTFHFRMVKGTLTVDEVKLVVEGLDDL